MNKKAEISGFTLVELIVVLSIFTIMLIFSFPLFKEVRFFSDSSTTTEKIAVLSRDLKKKSVIERNDYLLHIDTGLGLLWVSNDLMDDEEKLKAKEKGFYLGEDFSIVDVEFEVSNQDHEYIIKFSKQGYSDFVFIHVISDREDITIKIEPFLFDVQIIKGHVGFEKCS